MDWLYTISAPAAKFNAMLSCLFCPHRPATHDDTHLSTHSLTVHSLCCFSFLFGHDLPVFTSCSDVETDCCSKSTVDFFLFVFLLLGLLHCCSLLTAPLTASRPAVTHCQNPCVIHTCWSKQLPCAKY